MIVAASAGCSQSPRTLSFLPDAGDIQQIDIADVVRGPEAAAPLFLIEAHYTLISRTDAFIGRATFSVGSKHRHAEADVRVPLDAVDQFLKRLSSALLREGYAPQQPSPGGAYDVHTRRAARADGERLPAPGRLRLQHVSYPEVRDLRDGAGEVFTHIGSTQIVPAQVDGRRASTSGSGKSRRWNGTWRWDGCRQSCRRSS